MTRIEKVMQERKLTTAHAKKFIVENRCPANYGMKVECPSIFGTCNNLPLKRYCWEKEVEGDGSDTAANRTV